MARSAESALKKLVVRFSSAPGQSVPVGTLAERDRRVYFEYHADWLARGLELSPFNLPAGPGLIEHTDHEFGPLPGLFDDSLPDGWGLLLMDRHFRKLGLDPAAVSPLDRLACLATRTMGALTYHPAARQVDTDSDTDGFDLAELFRNAREVYAGQAAEVLPQLIKAGSSPGGARPKVLVGYNPATNEILSGEDDLPHGFEHWIVKFVAAEDAPHAPEKPAQAGPIEYAYSLMARAAGVEMPETRLFETTEGDRFFGVRRFDRAPGNRRFHVHTFGNLIHANFRIPACDYADLLKATSILTRNHQDVLSAFRLMAFNVLSHNRDDHAKNFAYILDAETATWSLSPAYDLTFSPGPGGEHTTTISGEGRNPSLDHMLQLAPRFGISPAEARSIIDQARNGVSHWRHLAAQTGAPAKLADSWPDL
jgi:serine/threonine-protein kinase HipA